MAVAGKVAITLSTENGGAWSADVTYDRLVAVKHNNNLYISRKTVANVEPPNDEFWFLALEGFGGDDVQTLIERLNELNDLIQAIINGTTQVGNAKTLDGNSADVFAKAVDLSNYFPKSGGTIDGSITIGTDSVEANRYFVMENNKRKVNMSLEKGGDFSLYDNTNSRHIVRSSADGTNTFNGTASGNLPLSGGIIGNGTDHYPLVIKGNDAKRATIGFRDNSNNNLGYLGFLNADNLIFLTGDSKGLGNGNAILHTGNMSDHVLPKSGGTLSGSDSNVLTINRKADSNTFIKFTGNGSSFGFLGFQKANTPVYVPSSGSGIQTILHTGNKPTGTYTGNGDATARQINVGGIGNMLVIKKYGAGATIVLPFGGICVPSDGSAIEFIKDIAYDNGTLYMSTSSNRVNQVNGVYDYEVK